MLLSDTIVDFHLFYDGAVDMWHMGLRDLRDRCDGNIKMKPNDEQAHAFIVDMYFTCMSTSGFVNTNLRMRYFIIRSVVTSTSKTISTNFSKYGH